MSISPIESPKVFISYSWDSDEYKNRVVEFATSLMASGIDVLLDRWSMVEGDDLYAFMERSVTDDTVTNVLMLLSPEYGKRADGRIGGVGAEAQIISAQLYTKTEQTKYIPVVFQLDDQGRCDPPAYLRSRLYFNLANPETYRVEFKRLVRRLYGHEDLKKPEVGKRPDWVDGDNPSSLIMDAFELSPLASGEPTALKVRTFRKALGDASAEIVCWLQGRETQAIAQPGYFELYDSTLRHKNELLHAISYYPYLGDEGIVEVADCLERLRHDVEKDQSPLKELKLVLLYEVFLSVIGMAYTFSDYEALAYLLNHIYQVWDYEAKPRGFKVFWHDSDVLGNAVREHDGRRYIYPLAKLFLDRADPELCAAEQLMVADALCFNAVLMKASSQLNNWWGPRLYVYDTNDTAIMGFAHKLHSRRLLDRISKMFGYENSEQFLNRYVEFESEVNDGKYQGYRNFETYNSPPFLPSFVKSTLLGAMT